MTHAPPRAEPGGLASVAVLGGDQRGDRHEVVRVGRVTESEEQRDSERHDERRSVEEPARMRGRGAPSHTDSRHRSRGQDESEGDDDHAPTRRA